MKRFMIEISNPRVGIEATVKSHLAGPYMLETIDRLLDIFACLLKEEFVDSFLHSGGIYGCKVVTTDGSCSKWVFQSDGDSLILRHDNHV